VAPVQPAPVAAPQSYQPAPTQPLDLNYGSEVEPEDAALELGGAEELIEDENEGTGGYASVGGLRAPTPEPLDLGAEQVQEPAPASPYRSRQDELRLDNEGPATVASLGGARRGFVGSPVPQAAPAAPVAPTVKAPATGSTLFERMTNLSRGAKPAREEQADEDESGSISIPRFLGRQNNQ